MAQCDKLYEKRRIRQQYLDEQRQWRRFTAADVAALREHRDAFREIMQINRELASDRARRRTPGPSGLLEVNPVSGKIHWPATLRSGRFTGKRTQLDTIFAVEDGYKNAAWDTSSEISG